MTFWENIKKNSYPRHLALLFLISFLLWMFCFRDFFFGRLAFTSDAGSYYDQIRFYITSLARGVYPLWNPSEAYGVPNDFFLARIGTNNPFLFIILILHKLHVPYLSAYLIFLAVYYFVGMFGFFMFAKQVSRNMLLAFLCYLLLMFSSLGTRLIDSYLLLVFVPNAWFFYFLFLFVEKQEKYAFLGMTLTLMMISTTYIPFYFLIIFFSFVLCFACSYFRDFKRIVVQSLAFVKNNPFLVCFCFLALMLALIPGVTLFQQMNKGELVLPFRHAGSLAKSSLTVPLKAITEWGIIEDIFYATYFLDLRKIEYAVVYLPIFLYILFALGLFAKIQKKLALLAVWLFGFLLFCSSSTIQEFLYHRISFFKFFRNFHFFLWVTLIPAFILLAVLQLEDLLKYEPKTKKEKYALFAALTIVHAGFLLFIIIQGNAIPSTYGTFFLSFLIFILYFYGKWRHRAILWFWLFLGLVALQPLEVYHYFSHNAERTPGVVYECKKFVEPPISRDKKHGESLAQRADLSAAKDFTENNRRKNPKHYFSGYWNNALPENLDSAVFNSYMRSAFIAYDRVEKIDSKNPDFKRIEDVFRARKNIAFVCDYQAEEMPMDAKERYPTAQIISDGSKELKMLSFNPVSITFKTNFESQKFLVHNNGYDVRWRAFVNGRPARLWRANVAFKGLWVPPGENIIRLSYGSIGQYVLRFSLLGISLGIFIVIVRLVLKPLVSKTSAWKRNKHPTHKND